MSATYINSRNEVFFRYNGRFWSSRVEREGVEGTGPCGLARDPFGAIKSDFHYARRLNGPFAEILEIFLFIPSGIHNLAAPVHIYR